MNDNLGVRVRSEMVAVILQLAAKFAKVINFAVVGDPNSTIFVRHRHVAGGREVDDAQPAIAEADLCRRRDIDT